MHFSLKRLKFWHKRQDRDGSTNLLAVSTGDEAVQPSRMDISNQAQTSHARPRIDDSIVSLTPNVSAGIQDQSATVLPQTPDPTADASQRALSTNAAAATPASLTATTSPEPLSGSLLGDLWKKAYDCVRTEEEPTVLAYEKLLDKRLQELNECSPLSASTQITFATLEQPEQLEKFVAAGFKKSEDIARAKENIKEFGRVAQPVKAVMNVVVQAAPQAALAWSCVSFALQILANPLTESSVNREGITYVLRTMKWYQGLVNLLIDDDSRTQELRSGLKDYLVELYKRLLIYQMKSVCRYNRREIYVLLRDLVKLDDWKGKLDDVQDAEKHVHSKLEEYQNSSIRDSIRALAGDMKGHFDEVMSAIQEQTRKIQNAQDQSKRQDCLRALRQMVDPNDEKERIQDEKGNLLQGCYSWILDHEKFVDWHHNKSTEILWITGDPGKGKTMLLCGIIDELEKVPTNTISYFFCQATQETLRSATAVLRGIIYGLAKKYPQLDHHALEKYDDGGASAFEGKSAWVVMRNILRAMLSDPHMDGVILIVDALDECVEGRQNLLEFICKSSRAPGARAKWIVSSRNWSEIEKVMGAVTDQTSNLSLESNDHVADAVRKYIEQKVADLATRTPFAGNQDLCNEVTDILNKRSGNTFLWVAVVCNALREGNVLDRRHVSGSKGILNEFPQGLDNLYGRMLEYIKSDARDKHLCKHVLAIASVMKRHVSLQELCSIMKFSINFDGETKTLESLVRCCGSFLNLRHGIVYFVHQSAVDFLHNYEKEAFKEIFPRGIKAMHRDVFISSIKATSTVVCRNIYGLRDSDGREALGMHRNEITPPQSDPLPPIQYASLHWIDHLSESGMPIYIDVLGVAHEFLRNKLLYWLEALTLLGQLSQAIQCIQKLQKLVLGIAKPDQESLSEFLQDANRFLLYHRFMIEDTPLQLYASALMFSPEQSVVRKQFWFEAPDWVTVTQGVDKEWDACLQTLIGHKSHADRFAHSPDRQWLISGDEEGIIKLWHADSGTCVLTLNYDEEDPVDGLAPQKPQVLSVAFSADGQSFTSAYANGVLKVFDRARGDCVRVVPRLAQSEDAIYPWYFDNIAISKDSQTVAYRWGRSISILKIVMGARPRIFRPDSNEVHAVALTADGQFLAASCGTGNHVNIEIWNTWEGKRTQIIRTLDRRTSLIFSADGRWLATHTSRNAVRVWERATEQCKTFTLEDGTADKEISWARSMAFSDDGNLIAASFGPRICVWNTTTGAVAWKSEKCVANINSLSFSPDALRLVSGLSDNTIKVWDLPKKNNGTPGSRFTQRLCYSDGLHFAACYPAVQEIGVWAGTTEAGPAVKRWHENDVRAISLAPDHRSLASASSEGIITVWDTETGDQKQTLDYRSEVSEITSLAFRGNSQLAVGSFGAIDIYDTSDGRHKKRYDEDCGFIDIISFSRGGQWLACRSSDDAEFLHYSSCSEVRVWDTKKDRCFLVSIGVPPVTNFHSLSFSADGQSLALTSFGAIYLCNLRSRTCSHILNIHEYVGFHVVQISFDANLQRRLHTQFGFLDFVDQEPNCMDARSSKDDGVYSKCLEDDVKIMFDEKLSTASLSFSGYGFSNDMTWVTQDQRKMFPIPLDYQREGFSIEMSPVIDGSTLIWISQSGRLLRVCFDVRV